MNDPFPTLSYSPEARAVMWTVALLLLLVVGLGVIAVIRAAHRRAGGADDAPAGLSLHELREMRARGELTDEEFERARVIVLRQAGVSVPDGDPIGASDDAPEKGSRDDPGTGGKVVDTSGSGSRDVPKGGAGKPGAPPDEGRPSG